MVPAVRILTIYFQVLSQLRIDLAFNIIIAVRFSTVRLSARKMAPQIVSPTLEVDKRHKVHGEQLSSGINLRYLLVIFLTLCSLVHVAIMGWLRGTGDTILFQLNEQRPSDNIVIPPYLIAPPQASNGYASFDEQCLRYCLSAYDASPYNKEASDDVDYHKQKLRVDQKHSPPPPRILHFIFIGDLGEKYIRFTFTDYIMIRAAYFRLQPDEIYLHSNAAPLDSPLWDLIQPMISVRKHLEPISVICGNVVTGKAHILDIARLKVLQEYGGMYMDIDSICLKPFTKGMWDPPSGLTMGYEHKSIDHIGCGVIIARILQNF